MTARPRLTIGVPVYNGEAYLDQALSSVVAQDYDDMEIVISDNGSTDGTPDIIAGYLTDPRVRLVRHHRNRGGVWNVNYLVGEARGQFFKWAYYDDRLRPGYVRTCMDALDAHGSGAVSVHTRVVIIDEHGSFLEERDDDALGLDASTAAARIGNLLGHIAGQLEFAIHRTDALRRTDVIQPFIGSELAMLTSLLAQGTAIPIHQQLLELRRHPQQYGTDRFSEGAWYAHEHQRGRLLPFTWLNVELARAVTRSRLPAAEKLACLGVIARRWTVPRWRTAAGDFRHLSTTIRTSARHRAQPDDA